MDFKGAATNAAIRGGAVAAHAVSSIALSAEAQLKLVQAGNTASDIATLSKQLSGSIGRTVAEIAIVAQDIVKTVRDDPRDFVVIRSFFDYNLGKAKEVIQARVTLRDGDEFTVTTLDKTINEVLSNFKDMRNKCRENDTFGAQVAAETLSAVIKSAI